MSNEKKNPLIGAFRTPAAGAPPTPAPTEPPTEAKPPAAAALPVKAAEVNKTVGPTENGKPTSAPPVPVKQEEGKKPVEPAKDDKAAKDGKPAAAPPAPAKQEEGKKPTEPAKDDKAAKDGKPAAAPPAPVKQEEGKKPPESIKAAETQKPVEQPKEPVAAATRTADGPKGSAVTKVFEERLDAPTEADLFKLPIPNEGEIFSMAVHPAYLRDFLDHPFTVNRETQDYKDLFESIKTYGIREPILCRPGRNGGLEIISGHRRHDISAQLNYHIPVLIERVLPAADHKGTEDAHAHRQGRRGQKPHWTCHALTAGRQHEYHQHPEG